MIGAEFTKPVVDEDLKKLSEYPTLIEYFKASGDLKGEERILRPFHYAICRALTQVVLGTLPGGKKKLAINLPPGHGKTFLAQAFVEWALGIFPESRFLYASFSADLAEMSTYTILGNVQSDWYQKVFPCCVLDRAFSKREFFNTTSGGYVKGVGFQGTITGFRAGRMQKELSKGFSGAIIIDDPLKAKDAYSDVAKEMAVAAYYGTISSRAGNKDVPIIAIGQRLAPDDFFGKIWERERDEWHIITFQGLDAEGNALWEEMKSARDYEALRETDEFTFMAQVQQNPQVPGGNIIKRDWWKYYDPSSYNVDGELIITADTAMKKTDKNDRSVFQLWNLSYNTIDLIEEMAGKWEFPELCANATKFYQKWSAVCEAQGVKPPNIYVEDKASGTPMAQQLRSMGVPCRTWAPKVYGFPDGKLQRVKMSLFHLRAGRVRLPIANNENFEWVTRFIEECANFSGLTEEQDDSVDCLTMAVSIWRQKGGGRDVMVDELVGR